MTRRTKPDAAPVAAPRTDTLTSAQKIELFGFDRILDLIEDGETQRDIAGKIGVDRRQLRTWISAVEDRRLAVQAAIEDSASTEDQRALQVLQELPADATPAQIAQARELASHYRWRAKVRNQKVYGEKQELTIKEPASAMTDEALDAEIARRTAKTQPTLQ